MPFLWVLVLLCLTGFVHAQDAPSLDSLRAALAHQLTYVGLYAAAGNQQGTYDNGTQLTITEASGRALAVIAKKQ